MTNAATFTTSVNKVMNNPDFLYGFLSMKRGEAFDADYLPVITLFGYERGRQFAMFYPHYTYRHGRGVSKNALKVMIDLINSKSIT